MKFKVGDKVKLKSQYIHIEGDRYVAEVLSIDDEFVYYGTDKTEETYRLPKTLIDLYLDLVDRPKNKSRFELLGEEL